MKNLIGSATAAAAAMTLASAAHAVVAPLEGRTITGLAVASNSASAVFEYDPNLNLTWLRDWDYAGSMMTWANANTWVSSLTVGNFGGWRLPSTLDANNILCGGYNCTGTEIGYFWYVELGNTANSSQPSAGNFQNFNSNRIYWINPDYYGQEAMGLSAWDGCQCARLYDVLGSAMPVRSGDVLAVPETQPLAMTLVGLGVLGFVVRRRAR